MSLADAINGDGGSLKTGRSARTLHRRAGPTVGMIACYLVATYFFAHGDLYLQGLVLVAAVFGILAVSLDLVAGTLGLYSLGHAGLFAVGAYATTILNTTHGWNLYLLLPVSMIGVGAVGVALGALSLRVSGLYFAIVTFIFTLLIAALVADFSFTGGYTGLIGPIFPSFGSGLSGLGVSVIWVGMLLLLLTMLVSAAVRRSLLYPALLAIRDAEPFAAAAGLRTGLIRIMMFGLSAALAGAAGWLFSFQGTISPSQFGEPVAINILAMVILGGINTTVGPVLGAVFVSVFPVEVSLNPLWQEVLFGGLLVVFIIVYPTGFIGMLTAGGRWALRRVGWSAPEAPPGAADAPALDFTPESEPATLAAPATESVSDAGVVRGVNGAANAVECTDIHFAYTPGSSVLSGVSVVVKPGTIHGLIGPNGSGKSTLVDIICGRLKPSAGTVALGGAVMTGEGPAARAGQGVMRTFQSAVLVRELSVIDNVGVGYTGRLSHLGVRAPIWPVSPGGRRDTELTRGRSLEALRRVGATRWSRSHVSDVPHGVEQLTQLAAACVSQPRTVILDEPLAGLSPSEVDHIAEILADLKRSGVSVILIEHQPRFVFALCDEVTVLAAGEVIASGPAAEIRAHERVREVYLGR